MPAPVDITDPFRALSDPTRREIVSLLAAGPLPVRMIAGNFPSISRPAVSKHLRILREGRLVSEERSGRERYYRLELGTVATTLAWMTGVSVKAGAGTGVGTGAGPGIGAETSNAGGAESPRSASRKRAAKSSKPRSEAEASPPPEVEPGGDSDDWKSW
ncbi:MAG: winged helix-turn-helix transcriptional regulator [bacterium]|nr:winged helix-turn-helix transcriptional regulator [bacterium]